MKTKLTKTLIESWQYIFDCAEGYEDEAYEEFLTILKREPHVENEAMQAGHMFENLAQRIAECDSVAGTEKYFEGAKKVAEIVRGGVWQVPVGADITVAGHELWLYGICDVIKAGTIYDLKFKMKSFGSLDLAGSYRQCSQHPIYLYCLPEAEKFIYLVSDGQDLYTEEYTRKNSVPVTEHIINFLAWLHTKPDLWQIYEERWAVG